MKKLSVTILAILFFPTLALTQERTERQRFMFDSVMNIMRDRSIPLLDRYYATGDIEYLARADQVAVLRELTPEAKEFEDKAVITRLYSLISMFYSMEFDLESARKYIDSAFIYIDKTDNEIIRGVCYYCAGRFFTSVNNVREAHENYFRAAECFRKIDPGMHILNEIYYAMSAVYSFGNDVESLKELAGWMKDIAVAFPVQNILKYTVTARYFQAMYNKTKDAAYLDSVTFYNRSALEIFYSEEQPYDVAYQISENYFLQAEVFYFRNLGDSARLYLDKAAELMNPKYMLAQVQLRFLYGILLTNEDKYPEAENRLNEGLHILKELEDSQFNNLLSDYYSLLSQVQEKQGRMKEALESERESMKYSVLHFDLDNNRYIQDLKAKYDLDGKQRQLDRLEEINRMYRQNRILYIGVGLMLLIIIALLIFISRRKQRISEIKLNEARLKSQLEEEKNATLTAKINETEQQYRLLMSENRLKQVNSYLEGLETERARLSKELHDNIANNILSVNFCLQNKNDAGTVDISRQLKDIHEQVRNISHELIPPQFKYASFTEILRDYVGQQNRSGSIKISLSISSDEDFNKLHEKTSLELYRIIQECVGNTVRHADASQMEILLFEEDNNLNLIIIDNGKGFDANRKHSGIGLVIVRERVKSLGGTLAIHTAPGKGTEINVTLKI
jgi:signal transduction histidine kinase